MFNFFQLYPRAPKFSGRFWEIRELSDTADFFHCRLDQMIELRHPLVVLASRLRWQELDANIAHLFANRVRSDKDISNMDLFGGDAKVVGSGVSPAGRPRPSLRLMISLLYLKHAFNEMIAKSALSTVIVDSTVQHKAIT